MIRLRRARPEADAELDTRATEDTARMIGLLPARREDSTCYRHQAAGKHLDGHHYMRRCTLVQGHRGECVWGDRFDPEFRKRLESQRTLDAMGYRNHTAERNGLEELVSLVRRAPDPSAVIPTGWSVTVDREREGDITELRNRRGEVVASW